ncbi:unnamed protein product [Phytomonas sp. Hart1]|nr:unnamed protein product [Phytomonas sp. Hart1]|eukprot:CCW70881.1 unnamed protein product [Phytomonas sp. isolate Hart1]
MCTRISCIFRRGRMDIHPWMGIERYPVSTKILCGVSKIVPGYDHFRNMRPQMPIRSIGITGTQPLVLYNRMDQIIQIENAIALQRIERQIEVTLSQFALGIRNADNFLEKHLMNKEVRPSVHTLWFHENGLREHQHILSTLAAHHLVPLFSLVSYDVERGKMSVAQAEEVYEELMDCSSAQPKIVQRELANQIIRVYCLNDDYLKAIDVIDEMKSKGIRRTFVSYAPLFRLIRMKMDAERQVKLLKHMYEVEGGKFLKFLFIDIPRMSYMFGVFIRYNWVIINVCFIMITTILTLFLYNFGVLIL